jgi:formylglycine-generating enzyme required for sulfatase activity
MLLDIIKQIVAKEGEQILLEPERVSAFFSDLAKDEPKPKKQAFIKCLEHRFAKILKDIAKEERFNYKENLAQKLHTEEGLDLKLCGEAINMLCSALFGEAFELSPPPSPSAPTAGDYHDSALGIDMIFVKGGAFVMGATAEQGSDSYNDEKPVHEVILSDFYICKHAVTQKLWKQAMGNNPSKFKGDDLPVERVSWKDAQIFLSKLKQMTGKSYRLPTEAEWEYAARGGSKSRRYKYSGSNNFRDVAFSGGKTHPVGQKQPNELGIYDMSGNVREWVNDWYDKYSPGSQMNPLGPKKGSFRVNRGGSWDLIAQACRVSTRDHNKPSLRRDFLGLRLALSL